MSGLDTRLPLSRIAAGCRQTREHLDLIERRATHMALAPDGPTCLHAGGIVVASRDDAGKLIPHPCVNPLPLALPEMNLHAAPFRGDVGRAVGRRSVSCHASDVDDSLVRKGGKGFRARPTLGSGAVGSTAVRSSAAGLHSPSCQNPVCLVSVATSLAGIPSGSCGLNRTADRIKAACRAAKRPEPADLARRPAVRAGPMAPLFPQTCLSRLAAPGP